MANVFSMAEVKNRPSRNGFDLSRKNLFTAKVGEILPVAVLECIPGDKHTLKTKWMTRTQPLNTAAYTRIKEYYDWYFVPTNLLWNKFDDFVMGQKDNNMKADSISESTRLSDQHPYVTLSQIWTYVYNMAQSNRKNFFNFSRAELTCKLLEYLGYGDFYDALTTATYPSERVNAVVNIFPLLAYQKIYQDHFRNSQWEKAYAPACNINYMRGSSDSLNIPLQDIDMDVENMFDLRYADWNKDYFMGLLPNSQYGDASVVAVGLDDTVRIRSVGGNSTATQVVRVNSSNLLENQQASSNWPVWQFVSSSDITKGYQARFSILQLRQAEAVQKMREIMQSHEQDYKSQVEARWNVTVDASKSDRCQWLGGTSSNIDINEVVNQAFGTDRSGSSGLVLERDASIKGKGVGIGDGYENCFTACHGYLVCIYHAVPLLDFSISGIKKHNLKSLFTDYAQPELDKTGMVSMSLIELYNLDTTGSLASLNQLLGYVPQYYEYKAAYDEVHGAFYRRSAGLEAWTAPVGRYYLTSYLNAVVQAGLNNTPITYFFFKVAPFVLDPIMSVSATASLGTDQLLVNAYFDIKSVRNLDYNGLPY